VITILTVARRSGIRMHSHAVRGCVIIRIGLRLVFPS
jgi:hypothetical protein